MLFVGVDLAERHSAAVAIDDAYEVQWESFLDAGAHDDPFATLPAVRDWWWEIERKSGIAADPEETIWAVERPYFHARNGENAYLVLGGLLMLMTVDGYEAHVITSNTWQQAMGYSRKEWKDPKKWATTMCEEFGYRPGEPYLGKVLARPKSDLRDAYLIARWLRDLCLPG